MITKLLMNDIKSKLIFNYYKQQFDISYRFVTVTIHLKENIKIE